MSTGSRWPPRCSRACCLRAPQATIHYVLVGPACFHWHTCRLTGTSKLARDGDIRGRVGRRHRQRLRRAERGASSESSQQHRRTGWCTRFRAFERVASRGISFSFQPGARSRLGSGDDLAGSRRLTKEGKNAHFFSVALHLAGAACAGIAAAAAASSTSRTARCIFGLCLRCRGVTAGEKGRLASRESLAIEATSAWFARGGGGRAIKKREGPGISA
jgi:hypothetical protein